MAYGLIYTTQFDGFNGQQHTLEIYKKDYTGDATEIICGGGAVIQNWGPDERNPPIKGCSIEVDLLNVEGAFPLSNFYSNEDDTFKIIHYKGAQVTFVGFMVYDDCSEVQNDFTHNISISANDALGLLKDVPLNQSPKAYNLVATYSATAFNFVSPNLFYSLTLNNLLQPGDRIVITGSSNDGTYNITGTFGVLAYTVAEIVATSGPDNGTVTVYRSNLQGRFSLADVLKFALAPTMLELDTHSYNNIRPVGGTTDRWLDDTFIDGGTWLKADESYDSCEKVLKDILEAFTCTLFQANGVWNIVRWNELRLGIDLGGFLCYQYTADMVYIDDEVLPDPVTVGSGSDIESGLIASLVRPFKMVREVFNYRQPTDILRNASFGRLGPLLAEYADGTDTIREYGMKDWEQGFEWTSGGGGYIGSTATRFIRVRYNSLGEETDRFGVIKGATGMFDSRTAAQSYPIEVRGGDRIRISWDYKTDVSQPGNVNIFFIVHIRTTLNPVPRSANNRYLNQFGEWRQLGQSNLTILSNTPVGSNTNQWQSVTVDSDEIPVDGLLTFKLAQVGQGPQGTKETHYKNIRFEIFRSVAGSTTIEGQIHTQVQQPVIHNAYDEEIFIDDAPSAPIAGALFLSTFTGPLQDLTTLWNVSGQGVERKLGQIITRDIMLAQWRTRSKLDGTLLRSDLTPLSVILYSKMPGLNFIPGSMEVRYKENKTDCTLNEQYQDGEGEDDLQEDYGFRYIYKTTQ